MRTADRLPSYLENEGLASIKLLACDMDLTLLADDKSQPEGMAERVAALTRAGVVFCPASGRPGPTLEEMFEDNKHDIAFCPDNGGAVIYRDQVIYKACIEPTLYHEVLACAVDTGRGIPVLCALDHAYVLERDRAHHDALSVYYKDIRYVESFKGLSVDSNKVTMYFPNMDSKAAFDEVYEPRFATRLSVTCSGDDWIDIMRLGVNKGEGIAHLCAHLGIDIADAAAVGDTYNDVQMLETVGHSFLVANAEDHMCAHADYLVPSNNERGVAVLIDAILAAKEQ